MQTEAATRPRLATDMDLHLYLTREMARRHGVNLSEAMHQGFLSRSDFAALVDRCRACTGSADDCRDHVEDHDRAEAAPPWCANAAVIEGLRGLV
ncbi:DUF6455 family protein [Frigidibacter sp. SD6-1]|uniref:DUF6455 family protein n=1 Tax=Frigidibacter sp. SD6-1 TaxID=3032581 RepID=UPI0024DF9A07|nr:DUF6455 family protein [Frigidibacter sp. SD6-1]